MKRRIVVTFFALALIGTAAAAEAAVLTFDDLNTRNNFAAMGIQHTYQGFDWYYTNPTTVSSGTGWAVATPSNPISGPLPTPVSGNTVAWNWDGPQSLWINFMGAMNVTGAYFAHVSSTYGYNANTMQMFGYDQFSNLVASSGVLNLTNTFQLLPANFSNIHRLEMRADASYKWFALDNLEYNHGQSVPTPEPSTLLLIASGLGGLAFMRRFRRK